MIEMYVNCELLIYCKVHPYNILTILCNEKKLGDYSHKPLSVSLSQLHTLHNFYKKQKKYSIFTSKPSVSHIEVKAIDHRYVGVLNALDVFFRIIAKYLYWLLPKNCWIPEIYIHFYLRYFLSMILSYLTTWYYLTRTYYGVCCK
jgi:hypothetical protein